MEGFNAREGLVTFPTVKLNSWSELPFSEPQCFNAREGLVTFPTHPRPRRRQPPPRPRFNAREGLVTFPTLKSFNGHHGVGVDFHCFNAREGLVTFPTFMVRR